MTDNEENTLTPNNNLSEANGEVSIPEPDYDRDQLIGLHEKGSHQHHYFFTHTVGYMWSNGLKALYGNRLTWPKFQSYVASNHKQDATDFAKGNIDWDILVQRIEDGVRDKFDEKN